MNAFALYKHYIALSFRGQMQYRASFIMLTISVFLSSGLEFIGIWAIFDRFGQLKSWTRATLLVAFAGNHFATTIRNGDFDRLLLRPRNTVQLGELQLMRIATLRRAFSVMPHTYSITWTVPKTTLVMASLSCACVFGGLFVLRATLCFSGTAGRKPPVIP